jgi:hypothetical protein
LRGGLDDVSRRHGNVELQSLLAMTKKRTIKSADTIALDGLVYEFDFDDHAEAERKIRRRLRYHGLGPYQQGRVDLLRKFKDQVRSEIHRGVQSHYFLGSNGHYAAMQDFDVERMIRDLADSYPDIPLTEIKAFVPFAVYLYYMR